MIKHHLSFQDSLNCKHPNTFRITVICSAVSLDHYQSAYVRCIFQNQISKFPLDVTLTVL